MSREDPNAEPMLIDAHLHLDPSGGVTAAEAVARLTQEMCQCEMRRAVVLHLLWQPWPVEEFAKAVNGQPHLIGFVNVDPTQDGAVEALNAAVAMGFRGVKLHPRLQGYRPDDPRCVAVTRRAGTLGFPVVMDCFPDGHWLMAGLNVMQYARLACEAPQTNIVVAHAAGHYCLDLLMLAKRIPNLWWDISFSWLYYEGPVIESMAWCMKSARYEKVLFGTDYPDRRLAESVARSLDLLKRFHVDDEARDKVLWKNAKLLLGL